MHNLRFMESPYLIAIYFFLVIACALGLLFLPVQPQWRDYLGYPFVFLILLGCASLCHPNWLSRVLPQRIMDRLSSVFQIRDFFLLALFFTSMALLEQTYIQLAYVLSAQIPYTDELLRAWDLALGLDWVRYFDWLHARPMLVDVMYFLYASFEPMVTITVIWLVLSQRLDRIFVFTHSLWVSSFLIITYGAFFPALGTETYLIADLAQYPNYAGYSGSGFVPVLEGLRSLGGPVVIEPDRMNGLVAFPSFHTAGAICIAYAFHGTRFKMLAWVYAATVIASAPIFGAHYFCDIISGAVFGFMVCAWSERLMRVRWAQMFPTRPLPGQHAAVEDDDHPSLSAPMSIDDRLFAHFDALLEINNSAPRQETRLSSMAAHRKTGMLQA